MGLRPPLQDPLDWSTRRLLKIIIFLCVAFSIFLLSDNVDIIKSLFPARTSNTCPRDEIHDQDLRLLRSEGCWGKALAHRWNRFYNDTNCKDNRHRYRLTKLLKFWIAFAEKHNIKYALMWGTLLGVVRVNDILPWDHDIDIIISYKDILKLERNAEKRGTFQIDDGNVHIVVVPDVALQHNLTIEKRARKTCQGKVRYRF
jgi:hypothetical protein